MSFVGGCLSTTIHFGAAAAATTESTMPTTTTATTGNSSTTFLLTPEQGQCSPVSLATNAVARALENTFRTEPEKTFFATAATRVLHDVMEAMLNGVQYEPDTCRLLAVTLAETIQKRIKTLDQTGYKLVINAVIGQADHSSLIFASRSLWDVNFDSFAEYTYKNDSMFAIGLVHAFFCD